MTAGPGPYRIPRPAPPADDSPAPAGPGHQPRAQLCPHCGAVGTHYLTCPSLQLPAGYRHGRDAGLRTSRGTAAATGLVRA